MKIHHPTLQTIALSCRGVNNLYQCNFPQNIALCVVSHFTLLAEAALMHFSLSGFDIVKDTLKYDMRAQSVRTEMHL